MDLIADTNVWYDIAAGNRDPARLKAGGNKLLATPISLFEIASLIDTRNFSLRKAAAQAVVSHADGVMPDTETHIVQLCGLPLPWQPLAWIEAFRAVAQAKSKQELIDGVPDYLSKVKRRVNVPLIRQHYYDHHRTDFEKKVVAAIDNYIPGYMKKRASGLAIRLKGNRRIQFENAIRSPKTQEVLFKSVFWQALFCVDQPRRDPNLTEMNNIHNAFGPYVSSYAEYVIGCATQFTPQPNDLGDSECFAYLQNGRRFLSSDKRWVKIARIACPAFVLDPERKV